MIATFFKKTFTFFILIFSSPLFSMSAKLSEARQNKLVAWTIQQVERQRTAIREANRRTSHYGLVMIDKKRSLKDRLASLRDALEEDKTLGKDGEKIDKNLLLSCAVNSDEVEFAELFLKYGASPDGSPELGCSLLLNAYTGESSDREKKIIKLLINAGAKLEEVDQAGDTALLRATAVQDKDMVEYLLRSGAVINKKNNSGLSALTIAAIRDNPDLVDFFLSKMSREDIASDKALWTLILRKINMPTHYPQHEHIIARLVDNGVIITNSLIEAVVKQGYTSIFELLVKKMSSKQKTWALIQSLVHKKDGLARFLLDNFPEIESCQNEESIILSAVQAGYKEYVANYIKTKNTRDLLSKQDSRGRTVLMCALLDENIDIAKTLFDLGADVHSKDVRGQTAVRIAISLLKTSETKKKREALGALVHDFLKAKDKNGDSVLVAAVKNNELKNIQEIVSAISNASAAQDAQLKRALVLASERGWKNGVKKLLSSLLVGVDACEEALQVAVSNQEIAGLLEDKKRFLTAVSKTACETCSRNVEEFDENSDDDADEPEQAATVSLSAGKNSAPQSEQEYDKKFAELQRNQAQTTLSNKISFKKMEGCSEHKIAGASCHNCKLVQNYCNNLTVEIQNKLTKKFNSLNNGLDKYKKLSGIRYDHIFGFAIKAIGKEAMLVGLHHDAKGQLGMVQGCPKDGVGEAKITWGGESYTKTFFPSQWSREEVLEAIMYVSKTGERFVVGNQTVVIGDFTKVDAKKQALPAIKIQVIINNKKNEIVTAYPVA